MQALQAKEINRIILTRPAVEAGERLGFLPGDILAKVDPYLRPLYDALYDMLEPEAVSRLMERGTIEVAPLAFMRGRTLNDSFIILDEAQNTTPEQMKMFLTRLGFGSKVVVTGDVTQIDLPEGRGPVRAPRRARHPRRHHGAGVRRARLGATSCATGSSRTSSTRTRRDETTADESTVFGADEQSEVDVDLLRWVRLARLVLAEERVPEDAELSVIFVDEQAITDLNERFLGGTGPTDVLAFPMDDDVVLGGRQPDQGGRGPGSPSEPGDPPTVARRCRGVPAGGARARRTERRPSARRRGRAARRPRRPASAELRPCRGPASPRR